MEVAIAGPVHAPTRGGTAIATRGGRGVQDIDGRVDRAWTEGGAAGIAQHVRHGVGRHALAVGTVRPERVGHVRDRENARGGRQRLTGNGAVVAAAVEPFVMRAGVVGEPVEDGDAAENLVGVPRVLPDDGEFFLGQRPALVEDPVRDGELADVVQQRHLAKPRELIGREAQALANPRGDR